jgi:hypothetical protein
MDGFLGGTREIIPVNTCQTRNPDEVSDSNIEELAKEVISDLFLYDAF